MQTLPVSASVAPRSAPRLRRGFRDGAALALAPLSRAAPVPSAAAALFAAPARVAHRRRAAPLAPPRGSLVLGATTRALAPRRAPASSLRPPAPRSRPSSLRVVSDASSGRGLSEFPVADRRAELSKMTMAKLKPLCKGCGLKMGGKKGELIDRLLEHEFGTADDEADVDPRDDIVGLANEWRAGRSVVGGAPGANPRRGRPRHERRGLREPLRPRAGRHLRGLGRTDRVRSMSMLAGGGSALVEGLRRDGRASRAGIGGI